MFDLGHFTLRDMTTCGAALRKLGCGAQSMEEVAGRIVTYFHDHLRDGPRGEKACVLVRFFKTHAFEGLPPPLQRFALDLRGGKPDSPAMKCMVLLASAGLKPEWNARDLSLGHQAIPLASAEMILRAPMISQLITQLGLEIPTLLRPDQGLVLDFAQHTFNVFHVPEALGCPYIPAQVDFVVPFGIRSVLGFGGMLPWGDLFAVILFARVHVSGETAELFKPLAISAKLALLPFAPANIFA